MNAESAESKIIQQVAREHMVLKKLLARIEDALEARRAPIDEVAALIAKLGDRLVKHFTLEEDGGYFADALRQSPQLVAKANDLLAQHPKMATRVRQLTLQSGAGLEPADWWQETMTRFKAFKDELQKHERAEDALIQDAYHQDIGSND